LLQVWAICSSRSNLPAITCLITSLVPDDQCHKGRDHWELLALNTGSGIQEIPHKCCWIIQAVVTDHRRFSLCWVWGSSVPAQRPTRPDLSLSLGSCFRWATTKRMGSGIIYGDRPAPQ
jgi:hypothetical protein